MVSLRSLIRDMQRNSEAVQRNLKEVDVVDRENVVVEWVEWKFDVP